MLEKVKIVMVQKDNSSCPTLQTIPNITTQLTQNCSKPSKHTKPTKNTNNNNNMDNIIINHIPDTENSEYSKDSIDLTIFTDIYNDNDSDNDNNFRKIYVVYNQ